MRIVAYLGFVTEQRSESDALNLPIDMPPDLRASDDEIYLIRWNSMPIDRHDEQMPVALPLTSKIRGWELSFSKEKRPSRRAA